MITTTNEAETKMQNAFNEVSELCKRMTGLLAHAEYGLGSWHEAVTRVGLELHAKLGEVFAASGTATLADDGPAQEAMMFLCNEVESMATRLAAWKERGCTGAI